jgi:hypothetical protein
MDSAGRSVVYRTEIVNGDLGKLTWHEYWMQFSHRIEGPTFRGTKLRKPVD